jgi:hypothetical protein
MHQRTGQPHKDRDWGPGPVGRMVMPGHPRYLGAVPISLVAQVDLELRLRLQRLRERRRARIGLNR